MHIIKPAIGSKAFTDAKLLLESYDLPVSDLAHSSVQLWALVDETQIAGVIGLEQCQDIGLLRSLAVPKDYQGLGLARRLCNIVLDHSKTADITQIYLLTETASCFFSHLGFEEIERADAPNALRATKQFSSLCPDSASLMVKR